MKNFTARRLHSCSNSFNNRLYPNAKVIHKQSKIIKQVVVALLVGWLLLTPDDWGSNPIMDSFTVIPSTVDQAKIYEKEAGNWPSIWIKYLESKKQVVSLAQTDGGNFCLNSREIGSCPPHLMWAASSFVWWPNFCWDLRHKHLFLFPRDISWFRKMKEMKNWKRMAKVWKEN